jgi:hypothetical protein
MTPPEQPPEQPIRDPGAGITWEDLPAAWKSRYGDDRGLGVYEYANALRREAENRSRGRSRGVSRYGGFGGSAGGGRYSR